MNKAVFLDRDGVINVDKNYVHKITDFEFIENSVKALKSFKDMGYKLIIITNQSGIGRGLYSIKDYKILKRQIDLSLQVAGIKIDAEYFCPHSPDDNCRCRKPSSFLIEKAAKRFNINLKESYFVGDKTSDIKAGKTAGLKTVLVRTGKGGKDKKYYVLPDITTDNLYDFSEKLRHEWNPKIIYIGNFSWENHLRGRNLFKGLKENDIEVKLINGKRYFSMLLALLRKDFDVVLTTGKPPTLLAILTRFWHRKKIFFDVYISDYENLVMNRKLVKDGTWKAKMLYFIDKYTCEKTDCVFLDTDKHAQWYYTFFGLDKNKFSSVLIGSDDERFHGIKVKKGKKFNVLFFGSFVRGHGIDVILRSAKLLEKENIEFVFAGKGIVFDEMVQLSKKLECKNVEFLGWIEQKELPKLIAKCDVCLGVFDPNEIKIRRSIPTKLFECAPMKKILITGDTPGMEGIMEHKVNGMLPKLGDEKDLASCILEIYKDKKLKAAMEKNTYKLYEEKFKTKMIGKQLLDLIRKE